MTLVKLPTIKVKGRGLIKPRAIKEGELAHVRFEFAHPATRKNIDGTEVQARRHYFMVPRAIAAQWVEVGVPQSPVVLEHSGAGRGLVKPDADILDANLTHVRVRFGSKDTKNFYVPPALARDWAATAVRFERLQSDLSTMMKGG